MALIKPGIWHETVWVSRTWQEDLWLEYGTATPPPSVTVGNAWIKRKRRKLSLDELTAITLLITSLSREENG